MSLEGKRIRVRGYVQGVGYRYFCLKQAAAMSIFGRANNKRDGSVEVIAVGESESLANYLDALRQGPSQAAVDSVEFTDLEQPLLESVFARGGFEIS